MENTEEKIKVYELDFGDTNLIDENLDTIIDWIKSDIHDFGVNGQDEDELNYSIKVRKMTRKEIDELPEWS